MGPSWIENNRRNAFLNVLWRKGVWPVPAHGLDMVKFEIVSMETTLRTRAMKACGKTPPKWSPYYITSNDNVAAVTNGDHETPLYTVSANKLWITVIRRTDDKEFDGAVLTSVLLYRRR